MRFRGFLGFARVGAVTLTLLAGCSSGGTSASSDILPAGTQRQSTSVSRSLAETESANPRSWSVLRPDVSRRRAVGSVAGFAQADAAGKGALFFTDSGTYAVYVYTTSGKLIATISGFNEPQGVAADRNGDVYVADSGNHQVLVYKNDYKTRKATLRDPGQFPAGIGIDARSGIVGVTNIISTTNAPGSVSLYAKGATMPCATVANGAFGTVFFGAFDDAGNFYVDGLNKTATRTLVGVVKGGCAATTLTLLTTSNAITNFPGGVQITPDGKIAIGDQGGKIYTYDAPVGNALGSPLTTTTLSGASDPIMFAFVKSATSVFSADVNLPRAPQYRYPQGGSPVRTIGQFVQPIGIAVAPGAAF